MSCRRHHHSEPRGDQCPYSQWGHKSSIWGRKVPPLELQVAESLCCPYSPHPDTTTESDFVSGPPSWPPWESGPVHAHVRPLPRGPGAQKRTIHGSPWDPFPLGMVQPQTQEPPNSQQHGPHLCPLLHAWENSQSSEPTTSSTSPPAPRERQDRCHNTAEEGWVGPRSTKALGP